MFYSLLLIAALGGGMYALARWRKLPPAERNGFVKKAVLWASAFIILAMVLAGRAPWLMGVLAALLALVARAAQFAPYIPMFKKIFGESEDASKPESSVSSPNTGMSRKDAADILGVDINASAEEVRAAHKRLMQRTHPDRGGSDVLAKQINTAKERLIG